MAQYKVMAKAIGSKKIGCYATYTEQQKAAAEKHARELAHYDEFKVVKLVEIPDKSENKPYSKKEIIYKQI